MEIKFKNESNQIETIKLEVDKKWQEVKANSIFHDFFKMVDDGNGIISKSEINTVSGLLKGMDFNQDGIVNINEIDNCRTYSPNYIIAKLIYNDIYEKNGLGFPTTGKDIGKHISKINKDNVLSVIDFYKYDDTDGSKQEEGIFSGILGEIGLSIEERKEYVKHIFKALLEFCKEQGVYTNDIVKSFNVELNRQVKSWTPADGERLDALAKRLQDRIASRGASNVSANGEIDADFAQNAMGDCWLLSGIKAIANNPQTLKILNECIKLNNDGSVTVTLKGVNKKYTISKQELNGANELASGDLDVRAIEIAVNRYFEDNYHKSFSPHKRPDIEGNSLNKAFEILLGTSNYRDIFGGWGNLYGMLTDIDSDLIKKVKSGKYLVLVSHDLTSSSGVKATKADGTQEEIHSDHAYSVVDADNKYIYVVNPWDSSQKLKLTHEQFKKAFNQAGVVSVKEALEA